VVGSISRLRACMDAKKLALHALGTWVFLRTGQRLRRAEAEPGEARRNALKSLARRKLAGIITEGMKEGGLLRSDLGKCHISYISENNLSRSHLLRAVFVGKSSIPIRYSISPSHQ